MLNCGLSGIVPLNQMGHAILPGKHLCPKKGKHNQNKLLNSKKNEKYIF
jgi:hypothetical protein